jgi:hypothetical protein
MLEQKIIGDYYLTIDHENYPENPREWDNFSTMVCFHRRYNLGDKHTYNHNDYNGWDEMEKDIIKNENVGIILPLYLYDHSGITISTTPFHCGWDSGQIGFIYVSRKTIFGNIRGYKILTKKLKGIVTERLLNELKCYDQYLQNEVYSFEIVKDDERVEYCGGYYDLDECIKEGIDMVNDLINENVIHQEML